MAAHPGADCTAGTSPPSPSSPSAPGERVPFVLTWQPSHQPPPTPVDADRGAGRRPSGSGGAGSPRCTYDGRWREAVRPLADHAQGADLRADRRHRRRRDHLAARAARRRRATGTTATAGCATPRSRCRRCSAPATSTRRGPGGTGCCARSPATRPTCRSCTALAGERRLPEYSWTGCPATRARARCGSATPPPASSSSTSTARSGRAAPGPATAGLERRRRLGRCSARCWTSSRAHWQRAGRGPVGGPRPAPALHALQGDGLGRRSTGRSRRSSASAWTARSTAGGRCATRSTPRSATRLRRRRAARSPSTTAPPGWTPRCC